MTIALGSKAKDTITGFAGVVTGRCEYLTGCNQLLVAPAIAKDGSIRDSQWFDEQRLQQVGTVVVKLDNSKTPGFDKAAPKR